MNVLQQAALRRAVRFARSPRGQELLGHARARLESPVVRGQMEQALAGVWRRVDTPANQARGAAFVRRMRAAEAGRR